ncbi:MAG: hypothetical protein M2R45_04535 [Verrucomicrobia subdivision 3 bacterium]|nr:hypothetical protein [Limisphaerales bacterium]MCS1416826.1 hypothetical protein [Limisphaerales bacterium]
MGRPGGVVTSSLAVFITNNYNWRALLTSVGIAVSGMVLITLSLVDLRTGLLSAFAFLVLIGLRFYLLIMWSPT